MSQFDECATIKEAFELTDISIWDEEKFKTPLLGGDKSTSFGLENGSQIPLKDYEK